MPKYLILLIAIALVAVMFVGCVVGFEGPHPPHYMVRVDVKFYDNGTVELTNNGGEIDTLNKSNPFIIRYNEKDISNQAIASLSGIPVILNPPEGLGRQEGSVLKITPPKNQTCPQVIGVTGKFSDGAEVYIMQSTRESCCGKLPYNPETSVCCNRMTFPRLSKNTRCCGNASTELEGCCKGIPYNYSLQDCCKDRVINKKDEICCNGVAYSAATTGCCAGKTFDTWEKACCGGTLYDPGVSYCCSDSVAIDNCNVSFSEIGFDGPFNVEWFENGTVMFSATMRNKGTVSYNKVTLHIVCLDRSHSVCGEKNITLSYPEDYKRPFGGGRYSSSRGINQGDVWEFTTPVPCGAGVGCWVESLNASYIRGPDSRAYYTPHFEVGQFMKK